MPVNSKELSNSLVEVINEMYAPINLLNVSNGKETENITIRVLEHQASVLKKGLVRVAVIGNTSSGKSTIINTLMNSYVVPENPAVCSPIPVWIYHDEDGEQKVEVIREEDSEIKIDNIDSDSFLKKYCYNISDAVDTERVRFREIHEANVAVNNDILAGGAILIDTLGIAATKIDTSKTLAVLNEGVDLVIFVTKNLQLDLDEVSFLREFVLGYEPEKRQVAHPVDPKNLIFVYNPHEPDVQRLRDSFIDGLKRCFDGNSDLYEDKKKLEKWAKENVFDVNALLGRISHCNSAYPYGTLAPENSTEKYKEEMQSLEAREKMLITRANQPSADKDADFGFAALEEGLKAHIQRCSTGSDSVALARIADLEAIINQIKLSAGERIENEAVTVSELEKIKLFVKNMKDQIDTDNESLRADIKSFESQYIKGFNNIFESACAPGGTAYNTCHGHVQQMFMPESFKQNFSLDRFKRLSESDKIAFLDPYVDDMVSDVTVKCREQVAAALKETRGGTGAVVPMDVLEKSRVYVASQGDSLNNHIKGLKTADVEKKLGVMLPTESVVDKFYNTLQTKLETQLLEAVSNSLSRGKDKFNAQRNSYIQRIKGGFFGDILSFLNGLLGSTAVENKIKKKIWKKIRTEYLEPLVDCCLEALGSFNAPGVAGGLYEAVSNAYDSVKEDIIKSRQGVIIALEQSIVLADEKIAAQNEVSEEVKAQMYGIFEKCEELEKRLDYYQVSLLC